jgi:site-specific recombinase XerD
MKFHRTDDAESFLLLEPNENQIIQFIVSLRNRGAAQYSLNSYYTTLKHFFEINDIILNWKKIRMFKERLNTKRAVDRPYKHAEIHRLLEMATFRERVLILLMCSAGLRVDALPYLSVGDLVKIEKYNLYEITVYKGEREGYKTYCTPECAAAIDTYLEYRRNRLQEIITEETPLLVNLSDKEKSHNGHNVGKRMTVVNIQETILRLVYDTGLRKDKKTRRGARHAIMVCHGLRKFFRSQLHFAGVDHLRAETLIGHSTGLVGTYTIIPEEELFKSYLTAVNHLTINEEKRLQLKISELTEMASRFDAKLDKIDKLAQKLGIA